jgi:putative PEP-CTERM system TPR-repeat lipoprotein
MRLHLIWAPLFMAVFTACSPAPPPEQQIAAAEQHFAQGAHKLAFVEVKSALQASPNNAAGRRLLGQLHLVEEDGLSAEKELRRARELGLPPAEVTPSLVKALLMQDRFDEVLALTADQDTLASAPAELQAARGFALLGVGDTAGAAKAINAALEADSQNAFALLARTRLQARGGDPDAAIVTARELVRLHPNDGIGWSVLGGLLAERSDYAGAEEAFTYAISHRQRQLADRQQRAIARIYQNKLDAAQEDVDQLLRQAPKSAQVQYVAGLLETQRGRPDRAVEALELSVQEAPNFPPALLLLATNYARLGKLDQAGEVADRLLSRAPASVAGRMLRARLLLLKGKDREASELLAPVAEQRPELAEAKQLLAMSLLRQGKGAEAEQLLAEVVTRQPDSALVQLQLGMAKIAGGKTAGGLEALERAGELAPDAAGVQAAIVAAQLGERDLDDALATAQRFAAEHADQAAAHNLEGMVRLARKEPEKAGAAFEKALALDPGSATASRGLAAVLAAQGNLVKAESLLQAAASRHPDDQSLAFSLAAVLERRGNSGAATELLQSTVQRHPDSSAARLLLAQRLLREGKAAEVVLVLDVPATRSQPAGMLLLAEAWLRTKQPDRAKTLLEELDKAGPRNPLVLTRLAAVYEAQGDWAGVTRVAEQLSAIAPDDPKVILLKARFLAARGQVDEARHLLAHVKLDPNDPDLLRTRLTLALRGGDLAAQAEIAQAQFDREPSEATAIFLAGVHIRSGAPKKAISLLADWLGTHPESRGTPLVLAGLYGEHGRLQEAIALYRRVLSTDPGNVAALNGLAWYLRKTSPQEALDLAERAYGRAPDSPAVADTLAMVLLEQGAYQQALETNAKAMRLAPADPRFRLHRAQILGRWGDRAGALAVLDELRAEKLGPVLQTEAEDLRKALGN